MKIPSFAVLMLIMMSVPSTIASSNILGLDPSLPQTYSPDQLAKFFPPQPAILMGNPPTDFFTDPVYLPNVTVPTPPVIT